MANLADLNDLYIPMLKDFGFGFTEEQQLTYYKRGVEGVSWVPVTGEGLKVMLPTKDNLNSEENILIFHPLTEDALKGESWMFSTMRKQANRMADTHLRLVLLGLGRYFIDHADNPPKKTKALRLMNENPDWNEKAYKKLQKILKMTNRSDPKRHLIGIYTHGCNIEYRGKVTTRMANVSSALLDALKYNEKEVYGISYTKKERKAMMDLIESVLPGINDKAYDEGSDSKHAPYLDAYIGAWTNLEQRIIQVAKYIGLSYFFDDITPVPEFEWYDKIKHIPALAKVIPPQRGNIGNDVIGSTMHDIAPKPPKPDPIDPNANRPIHETAPVQQHVNAQPQPTAQPTTQPMHQQPIQQQPTAPQQPQAQGRRFGSSGTTPQYAQTQQPMYQQPQAVAQPMYQQQPQSQGRRFGTNGTTTPVYNTQPVQAAAPQPMYQQQQYQQQYQQPVMQHVQSQGVVLGY